MKGKGGNWAGADIERLKQLYGRVPTEELADTFGRSCEAVRVKAKRLGLEARHAPKAEAEVVASYYEERVRRNACELYREEAQRRAYREGVRWAMSVLHGMLKAGKAEDAAAMSGELGKL